MIHRILRLGFLLWLAASLAALPFGRRAWYGVLIGGALGLANFYALVRVIRTMLSASGRRAALLGVLLATKFVVLAAFLFASLRYAGASPLALFIGLSVVVVAMLGVSLRAPEVTP